jgi:hypothetical protein
MRRTAEFTLRPVAVFAHDHGERAVNRPHHQRAARASLFPAANAGIRDEYLAGIALYRSDLSSAG